MRYHSFRFAALNMSLAFCLSGLSVPQCRALPLALLPTLSQSLALRMSFHTPSSDLSLFHVIKPEPLTRCAFEAPIGLTDPIFTLPYMVIGVRSALERSDPSMRLVDWGQVLDISRVGVFVIPLRSDPGERTNILLAAQAVNNTVVEPGQVFSFNDTVGERTPDRGYQDGLMFSDGQVIRGTGGGICAVATGIYNAALQAGMGLIERHAHSGVVGYAPPGCDASVVYGAEDMRFLNTSDAPIIVRTRIDVDTDKVVIGLYGKTPIKGSRVQVRTTSLSFIHAPIVEKPDAGLPVGTKPIVEQKPRLGFDVSIERIWTQNKQVVRSETVVTEHHEPMPEIVRVPLPPAPASPAAPVVSEPVPPTAAPLSSSEADQ